VDGGTPLADQETFRQLQALISQRDHRLVFLVGAGISSGRDGMPSTAALIETLVRAATAGEPNLRKLTSAPLSGPLGFEMVLNDLWQICPAAVDAFFAYLERLDTAARPTIAHAFLGEWLGGQSGSVLTTNYDRLIERTCRAALRFDSHTGDRFGFDNWQHDLVSGSLFKLHGSLERTSSCLGALEHVGTTMIGSRADLVRHVFGDRPVCIVGWRGADPDIPPLIRTAMARRPAGLPLFWVHHTPESVSHVSPLLRDAAMGNPIVGSAEEFFAGLDTTGDAQRRLAMTASHTAAYDSPPRSDPPPDNLLQEVGCDRIELRRGRREASALRAFRVATAAATSDLSWAAAEQEHALTIWGAARGQERRELLARSVVAAVVARLRRTSGVGAQQLKASFGLLSMTVSLCRRRPELLFLVPRLLRLQRRALAAARAQGADNTDAEISKALTDLYEGRVRLRLAGNGVVRWRPIVAWVLRPYHRAMATVSAQPDRSLHARFDVVASLALAAARLGLCAEAVANLDELDRLSLLLTDPRRVAYWVTQRRQLTKLCRDLS
jgi:hypothetical protein